MRQVNTLPATGGAPRVAPVARNRGDEVARGRAGKTPLANQGAHFGDRWREQWECQASGFDEDLLPAGAGPGWQATWATRVRGPELPACTATPAAAARWIGIVLIALVAALAGAARAATGADADEHQHPAQTKTGTLAEGTRFATPFFVRDSGREGPTVLVVGGIHGNEPAGAVAADQIRHWPIVRGRLVVVPRANVPALEARKRRTPGVPEDQSDLNRNFPRAKKPGAPQGIPAGAIWKLAQQFRPTWVIDLHEGYGFRQLDPNTVGSSIIVFPTPETARVTPLLLTAVNRTIDGASEEPPQERNGGSGRSAGEAARGAAARPDGASAGAAARRFVRLSRPADGSLARAAGEHLGANALIVETTWKGQPLALRVRQHRIIVHRLLNWLSMVEARSPADQMSAPQEWLPGSVLGRSQSGGQAVAHAPAARRSGGAAGLRPAPGAA